MRISRLWCAALMLCAACAVCASSMPAGPAFAAGSPPAQLAETYGPDELAKLALPLGAPGSEFGRSVAISGDTAVVGVAKVGTSGTAYVYVRSGSQWVKQAELPHSANGNTDGYGCSVAISGDTVVVGAYTDRGWPGTDGPGQAYIWGRIGDTWALQQVIGGASGSGKLFGYSVAISGDTVLVGAPSGDGVAVGTGTAYVYTLGSGGWALQTTLLAADGQSYDDFGGAVAIAGDTAVVGAFGDDVQYVDRGSAYIYERTGSTWTQQSRIIGTNSSDSLGCAVAVSGDTALLGAYGEGAGTAYVYTRSGATWTKQARIASPDTGQTPYFGASLALSGDTAIIGEYGDDSGTKDRGSAYVYSRSGTTWAKRTKLVASDAATYDYFGLSVALSDGTAMIGSYGSDTGAAYMYSGYVARFKEDRISSKPSPGVLGDFQDSESDPLTTQLLADVSHGHLSLSADGSFTYTPDPDWSGIDYFTFRAFDGSAYSDAATATIVVTAVNDAPTFVKGGDVVVAEDSGTYTAPWATSISPGPQETEAVSFVVSTSNPALFSTQPTITPAGDLTFYPAANANGSTVVTATLRDAYGLSSAPATFSISVTPVNDAPVAHPDSYSTPEDATRSVPATGVVANDGDVDNTTLQADLVSPPLHGTLALAANGSFTYVPNPNWNGTDFFTYTAFDGLAFSEPTTVTITVTAVNDPPTFAKGGNVVVTDDSGSFTAPWASSISPGPLENEAVTFTASTNNNALFNAPPHIDASGTLSFSTSVGHYGSALVTVTARDAAGALSAPATFTVTTWVNKVDRATVSGIASSYVYAGAAIEPVPVVALGGKTLAPLTDYTVSYSNNAGAGTATLTVTGCGVYVGAVSKSFSIIPSALASASISGIASSYAYTGSGIVPVPSITLDGKTLSVDTDFTLSGESNVAVGTATLRITGRGNYAGTVLKTFSITPASVVLAAIGAVSPSYPYTGASIRPTPIVLVAGRPLAAYDFSTAFSDNIALGTATLTITGKGNYAGTASKTFVIDRASVASATVSGVYPSYAYTGAAIEPTPTVTMAGRTLTPVTDYTVSYANNSLGGTATITISGVGNYTGSIDKAFRIGLGWSSSLEYIYVGDKFTLNVSGQSGPVAWASSDATIASVTTAGLVTGRSAGVATITATCDGVQLTCRVNVANPQFSETEVELLIRETYDLDVTGGSGSIKWSSSNRSVATVSGGHIVAVGAGSVTITAVRNGVPMTCAVTVYKRDLRVSLSRGVSAGRGYVYVTAKTWNGHVVTHRTVKLYRSGSYVGSGRTDSHGKARIRVSKTRTDRVFEARVTGDRTHYTTSEERTMRFATEVYSCGDTDLFSDSVYLKAGKYRLYVYGDGNLSGWVGPINARGSDGSWKDFHVTRAGRFGVTGISFDYGGYITVSIDRFL